MDGSENTPVVILDSDEDEFQPDWVSTKPLKKTTPMKRRAPKSNSQNRRKKAKLQFIRSSSNSGSLPLEEPKEEKVIEHDLLWTEKFAPTRLEDVVVPKKKIEEVKRHLVPPANLAWNPVRVLVLHGPPGCGKQTMLRLLSMESQKGTQESVAPFWIRQWQEPSIDDGPGPFTRFLKFLMTPGSVPLSVGDGNESKMCRPLTVVPEIPELVSESMKTQFEETVLKLLSKPCVMPTVFMVSGTRISLDFVFGRSTVKHPGFKVIPMNPVTLARMKRELKRIADASGRMSLAGVKKEQLVPLIEASGHDLRFAIMSLQMWSVHDFGSAQWFQKDDSVNLYRLLGHGFYCDRGESREEEMDARWHRFPEDHPLYRKPLIKQPDRGLSKVIVSSVQLLSWAHENVVSFVPNGDDLADILESFSALDTIHPVIWDSPWISSATLRSLAFFNRHARERQFTTFRPPPRMPQKVLKKPKALEYAWMKEKHAGGRDDDVVSWMMKLRLSPEECKEDPEDPIEDDDDDDQDVD